MASQARFAKVMGAQLRAFVKENNPHLLAMPSEIDCSTVHFLVVGLDDDFAGGEYLFRLVAPHSGRKQFPHSPPRFEFLTPNGVYDPGGAICISIGEFHADNRPGAQGAYGWRPALGLRGFAREVVNGLVHNEGLKGVRIVTTSEKRKRDLAIASRRFNAENYASLIRSFEAHALDHPDAPAAQTLLAARRTASATDNETTSTSTDTSTSS